MHNEIRLLARMVEHTPVTIIVTQREGIIQYVNFCGEQVLHVPRNKLLGQPLVGFVGRFKGGLGWDDIHETLNREQVCETNTLLVCPAGEEIICRLKAFSIYDNNQLEALVFMFLDITFETRNALQIEDKNLEMARINSELIRSNHELKKLSELKSSFLSIASHELKTPLTTIKGYSDIIMDNMRDRMHESVLRMVENINRAAERLHKVINDILDVTRIEQKRLRLHLEPMNITRVIRECIDEVENINAGRQISFLCEIEDDLPRITGDKIRVRQVFMNLFTNAVKFSPDNSTVKVTVFQDGPDDQRLHCVIADQGIGINAEDQDRIFDSFYEVANPNRHSTHASKFMGGGTGLGLSIVNGVIACHGGRVWVESEGVREGEFPGSRFHVILPFCPRTMGDDLVVEEEEGTGREQGNSEEAPDEEVPTILLVDKDEEAIASAHKILDSAFAVQIEHSGSTGLVRAFSGRPAVLIISVEIEDMDPYLICRILRSQSETRSIPVIFASPARAECDFQKCFDSGADDIIIKPFHRRELVEKIWRILMKKKEEATFR